MSKSLIFAHFLFFDERCERFTHDHSFPLSDVSKLLRSLFKNEWCERIAFVAHQKWATMSDSLTSLWENERLWANCSCGSPKMSEWVNCSFFEWIAQTPIFGQKTSDSLGKPMSEFPALQNSYYCRYCFDVFTKKSQKNLLHRKTVHDSPKSQTRMYKKKKLSPDN